MSANDNQVGGTHYKDVPPGEEQHWDMMWRLYGEAWFVGNVTKYVLRYRKKNGVEDLKKARHYLDKLIELEEQTPRFNIKTMPLTFTNLKDQMEAVKPNEP